MTILPTPSINDAALLALVRDPRTIKQGWADQALCVSLDADPFFTDEPEPPAAVLAYCTACPVAANCLAAALAHEEVEGFRFGWWGGVSSEGRDQIARRLGLDFEDRSAFVEHLPLPIRIRTLREQGRTVPQIADECGCTKRTVYRHLAASA